MIIQWTVYTANYLDHASWEVDDRVVRMVDGFFDFVLEGGIDVLVWGLVYDEIMDNE